MTFTLLKTEVENAYSVCRFPSGPWASLKLPRQLELEIMSIVLLELLLQILLYSPDFS